MSKLLALLLVAAALQGCSRSGSDGRGNEHQSGKTEKKALTIQSSAFDDGDPLPPEFTCDGAGELPPLSWSATPKGAAELALVVTDSDAPGGPFLHLAAFGLDPGRQTLDGKLPEGARQAKNDAGKQGWAPPCPREGDPPHHYRFTLLAMGSEADIKAGASGKEVDQALTHDVIATATVTAIYSR